MVTRVNSYHTTLCFLPYVGNRRDIMRVFVADGDRDVRVQIGLYRTHAGRFSGGLAIWLRG